MAATDKEARRCRRPRIDADGQAVPGKELPKLTEATSDSFVSTQEGRRVAFFLDRPGRSAFRGPCQNKKRSDLL